MSRRNGFGGMVSAVADCAPVRGTTSFPRARPTPLKTVEPKVEPKTIEPTSIDQILDSGFHSATGLTSASGLTSPTSPTPSGYRFPKEASARPESPVDAASRLWEKLSGFKLDDEKSQEKPQNADEQTIWEKRYIKALEEAFVGDEDGDTYLHLAIIFGMDHVTDFLMHFVPHPDFLNLRNSYFQTPLHLAALTGQTALCRKLLVAGADPNKHDRHGNTPLHVACSRGDLVMAHALTAPVSAAETKEAALRYTLPPTGIPLAIDEWNYQGLSCLHLAVLTGDLQLVAHLVAHGADVGCMEGKGGRTPLHLAVESGNIDMLRFLAEMCGADVWAETYGGVSSYQLALHHARLDVADVLETLGMHALALSETDSDSGVSDSDADISDTESEVSLKCDDLLADVRIGGRPLVIAL